MTAGAFHHISTTNQGKDDERTSWTIIRTHIKAAIHLRGRTTAAEAVIAGAAVVVEGEAIAAVAAGTMVISGKVLRHS